ncbi:MAG TPA: DUF533 domain-containing protein [Polyangiaceae bacterium]|jgi:tellurite resistance protein
MTPAEKNIIKALVAVAWADGTVSEPEVGMIDSLLWAFEATEEEEAELRQFAQTKRTVKDISNHGLSAEERELIIAHAALLTHADGKQSREEQQLLTSLVQHLGLSIEQSRPIINGARDRAAKLAGKIAKR